MGTVCAEQQHKFHTAHQLFLSKKTLREIDIPPRKLLGRGCGHPVPWQHQLEGIPEIFVDSPKAEEALLQKFLPYNNTFESEDDDDDEKQDPYSSDHFRMYEFKVRKCTRSRSHDWTDCPFAHPGEKARRRDPRRYHYSGTVCAEFRRGNCSRGDNCEFAHGVFECWLHPARYRTEACKDGKNCKRKVCFFAHTPRQLRVLASNNDNTFNSPVSSPVCAENKFATNLSHCCTCHHHYHHHHHSMNTSPTSTLIGLSHFSPPMSPSPPLSPVEPQSINRFSPICRYPDLLAAAPAGGLSQFNSPGAALSYKDLLTELMSSMEAMNVNESSPHGASNTWNLPWVEANFNGDDQQQFVLYPSTPIPSGVKHFFTGDSSSKCGSNSIDDKFNNLDNSLAGPDLGWVNDLLT